MGVLKTILDESIKSKQQDTFTESQVVHDYKGLKKELTENIGKHYLWYNHITKKLLLVQITKPYDRYTTVTQTILNLDKEEIQVTHSVSYSYLYSELDKLYSLEGDF